MKKLIIDGSGIPPGTISKIESEDLAHWYTPYGAFSKIDGQSTIYPGRTASPLGDDASPPRKESRFWMVYSPSGGAPTYRHDTRESAGREAQRLAKANPGKDFYVLKAMDGFCARQPEPEPIKLKRPARSLDDGIPF